MEYALVLAVISVVAISALIAMGGGVKGTYTSIDRQLAIGQNGGPLPTQNRGNGG